MDLTLRIVLKACMLIVLCKQAKMVKLIFFRGIISQKFVASSIAKSNASNWK
jgi:hypothetical protein